MTAIPILLAILTISLLFLMDCYRNDLRAHKTIEGRKWLCEMISEKEYNAFREKTQYYTSEDIKEGFCFAEVFGEKTTYWKIIG